jgi:FkbM family methyltransferase
MAKLIYDVGMHRGEDTEFYLSRGFRVVGVEANPYLVEELRSKFSAEIRSGALQLVDRAISNSGGIVRFAINKERSVWGSISDSFIERNAGLGTSIEFAEVKTISFDDLVRLHGIPYYLKIDIEGMDMECIKSLHKVQQKPRYLSIESAVTCAVAEVEASFDELAHLWVLGYRCFKYVDQAGLRKLDGTPLDVEGIPVRYKFRQDSSGPFGEESPGEWLSIGDALREMKALILYQNTLGMGGRYHKNVLSKAGRRLRQHLKRLKSHSWYDLHARYGE